MASFHFSREKPDDTLLGELATADKFSDEAFTQFANLVFGFLTQPKQANTMMEQIEKFAGEQGVGEAAMKNVVRSWLTFLQLVHRGNLSLAHLQEDLQQLGLSESKVSAVCSLYKANYTALARSVVGRTLMVNQLVDMEWKFGVTAGSSEARRVGSTFLQMRLSLDRGSKTEDVHLELSLPQFYEFLREMERAKASLEVLS